MMKNRQILFLCVALCATLTSFAQTTFTVDGLDYEVISTNPNEVKLTGGTPATTTLNIPASVIDNGTTYSVTVIGFAAFGFDDTGDVSPSTITALTIPNTITVIEDFAFNSNQITGAVTIPNSVTTLGVFLFRGNEITSASLPNTLSAIPTGIFEENLLTSITLPDTVVSIGKDAFADNFLTSITIPDSVTSIEEDAFFSNNLMSITIPDSVTSIGDEAFEGNNLTNLIIPSSVTVIGGAAFGLNPITAVTALGNTAPSMMISAFSDVTAATLFIPQNTLEDYVANGWSVFGTIVAGDTTFESAFTVNSFNFLVTSLVPSEVTVLGQEGTLTSIDIPTTVSNAGTTYNITEISSNAFRDNNLTALTLPNTLREINFAAFEGNALTTLVIPNSVTALGSLVFDNNAISELTLGTSITTISNFSFRNNQLTNVTIPSAVTTVFGGAFINNPLATVTVEGIEPPSVNTSDNFDSFSNRSSIDLLIPEGTTQAYLDGGWTGFNSINGVFVGFEFEVNGLTYRITSLNSLEVAVTGGTAIPTDLVLPEVVPFEGVNYTLVGVDFRAFDAEGLDSVILPNTLRNIGDFAFENNEMPSVEIPEGVETISFRSFRGNTLTTITIPSTVTSIAQDAFANNPLQTITALGTIPASIETLTFDDRSGIDLFIPEGTLPAYINAGWTDFRSINSVFPIGSEFDNNGLLYRVTSQEPAEVEVTGGTSIPTDLVLPEVVPFEGENYTLVGVDFRAFDAEGLDSVILPNTLRNIGDFAFENNEIPSVEIPEGVEIISFRSFRGNTFTAITIPSTVTSIAQDAFANNPLQTITTLGTIPASIETLTFDDRSGIDLFIPEGTEQAYLDAGWIGFASVTEFAIDITVAPKVFLQGAATNPIAGEEDLMRDSLRENGLLPTISPYGDGATVDPTVFDTTGPNAIVDWVRVELRTGVDSDNTIIVNSKAALLQRDGDIVDLDGSSNITFTEEDGDYFIAIIHRNHIGILAAVPASLSSTASTIDFTQDAAFAKGENLALTQVNGTFAMIAGDADGSSQILNTDITEALGLAGGGESYSTADADMNGFVLNSDIQLLVLANSGTVQQFE